ncbi:MAG: SDR family NAD(P)-dependent oxidoreductase, partial [Novosphingobium sp.]
MTGSAQKVAIVTGVASPLGIGFAIADRLTRAGTAVLVTDIDSTRSEQRAAELRARGDDALAMAHDVSSEDDWRAVFDRARTQWGGVDHLVNNAGVLRMSGVDSIPRGEWDLTITTNLTSCYLGIKQAAEHIGERGGGAIVNMCSVSGILGTPN